MLKYNKIIFLDIDGVLSTGRCKFMQWDTEAMDNLLYLINETSAHIVVSSSWRDSNHDKMIKTFKEHGCYKEITDRIIGITCRGYTFVRKGSKLPIVRGNEIKEWIDIHLRYPWHGTPELDKEYTEYNDDGSFKIMRHNKLNKDYFYVILDDDTDMLLDQGLNFVRTDINIGLTRKDADKAINILNGII